MADIDSYEIRRREWKEGHRDYGERIFAIPKATVDTLSSDYAIGTLWPGASGTGARRIREYQIERDFPNRAGMSRVRALYKEGTWGDILEQNVNKGRLLVKIDGQREERSEDTNDKQITGPDATTPFDADGTYFWRVTEGTNVFLVPRCTVVIDAAVDDWNANTIIGLVGCYNAAQCSNIGNAAAKTLLLLGAQVTDMLSDDPDDPIYRIQYQLQYNSEGWDAVCKAAKFIKQAVRVKEKDENGNDTGNFRTILAISQDGAEEDRTIYTSGDFTTLNGYLSW